MCYFQGLANFYLNKNFHYLANFPLGCLYYNIHYNIASRIDCDVAASYIRI